MLNISLLELTGRAAEYVLAHEARLGVNEGHHVLQLVAETEGAPRLVVSAPRPNTARQRLVQKPPVGQQVEGLIRCVHIYRAESVVPVLPYRFERVTRSRGSAETMSQTPGVIGVSPCAEREYHFMLLPVAKLERNLDRGTRIQPGPHFAGKARPAHCSRTPKRAVTPKELSAVAG